MKRLKLHYDVEVYARGKAKDCSKMNSGDLFLSALEGCEENRKTLRRINMAGKVVDKFIEAMEVRKEAVELEDAEFDLLKESMDKVEFNAMVLHFREPFKSLEEADKVV